MATTLGQKRIVLTGTENEYQKDLKSKAIELIDLVNQAALNPKADEETLREWLRYKAMAMTAIEEGVTWGVKAEYLNKV